MVQATELPFLIFSFEMPTVLGTVNDFRDKAFTYPANIVDGPFPARIACGAVLNYSKGQFNRDPAFGLNPYPMVRQ